jgi:CDGSH-type Zn-finger protein
MSKGGHKPVIFTQDKDETVYLCGCKQTGKGPRCDGSHKSL